MSPLAHAAIALAAFLLLTPLVGPAGGALFGIGAYWLREGTEAQYATRRPKADVWWVPFTPWWWPQQMLLDFIVPSLVVMSAWAGWVAAWGG